MMRAELMGIKTVVDQPIQLQFYNTLSRSKEDFVPIVPSNVRMYVCGPTVYDFAHIGNARPVIVFDVLYRLLRHVYGKENVAYVRNITDVDDKINARAARDFPDLPLNEAIGKVTETTTLQFQSDMAELGCLEPNHEPRATEFIGRMADMIETLISKGNAYVAKGSQGREVLFRVDSMEDYGALSNRKLEDQQAGARVAVEEHKENPADFVLWKESDESLPGWDYEFDGQTIHGRPGWHIECSAMSEAYLGKTFDIHGGGLDLIFPHHENEIAQSRCCHDTDRMANVWMHNGFLQVEGKKMSKSDGNFHTVNEVLHTDKVGGRSWPGEVIRLAMLMTHYREPIDFSISRLEEAEAILAKWHRKADGKTGGKILPLALSALADDLEMADLFVALNQADTSAEDLAATLALLGFNMVAAQSDFDPTELIEQRTSLIEDKNWAEADRIRDELLDKGILLSDSKDSETGKRITTWEVKR